LIRPSLKLRCARTGLSRAIVAMETSVNSPMELKKYNVKKNLHTINTNQRNANSSMKRPSVPMASAASSSMKRGQWRS